MSVNDPNELDFDSHCTFPLQSRVSESNVKARKLCLRSFLSVWQMGFDAKKCREKKMQISKKEEKIALISMELKTEETQPLTSMKQAAIWSKHFLPNRCSTSDVSHTCRKHWWLMIDLFISSLLLQSSSLFHSNQP